MLKYFSSSGNSGNRLWSKVVGSRPAQPSTTSDSPRASTVDKAVALKSDVEDRAAKIGARTPPQAYSPGHSKASASTSNVVTTPSANVCKVRPQQQQQPHSSIAAKVVHAQTPSATVASSRRTDHHHLAFSFNGAERIGNSGPLWPSLEEPLLPGDHHLADISRPGKATSIETRLEGDHPHLHHQQKQEEQHSNDKSSSLTSSGLVPSSSPKASHQEVHHVSTSAISQSKPSDARYKSGPPNSSQKQPLSTHSQTAACLTQSPLLSTIDSTVSPSVVLASRSPAILAAPTGPMSRPIISAGYPLPLPVQPRFDTKPSLSGLSTTIPAPASGYKQASISVWSPPVSGFSNFPLSCSSTSSTSAFFDASMALNTSSPLPLPLAAPNIFDSLHAPISALAHSTSHSVNGLPGPSLWSADDSLIGLAGIATNGVGNNPNISNTYAPPHHTHHAHHQARMISTVVPHSVSTPLLQAPTALGSLQPHRPLPAQHSFTGSTHLPSHYVPVSTTSGIESQISHKLPTRRVGLYSIQPQPSLAGSTQGQNAIFSPNTISSNGLARPGPGISPWTPLPSVPSGYPSGSVPSPPPILDTFHNSSGPAGSSICSGSGLLSLPGGHGHSRSCSFVSAVGGGIGNSVSAGNGVTVGGSGVTWPSCYPAASPQQPPGVIGGGRPSGTVCSAQLNSRPATFAMQLQPSPSASHRPSSSFFAPAACGLGSSGPSALLPVSPTHHTHVQHQQNRLPGSSTLPHHALGPAVLPAGPASLFATGSVASLSSPGATPSAGLFVPAAAASVYSVAQTCPSPPPLTPTSAGQSASLLAAAILHSQQQQHHPHHQSQQQQVICPSGHQVVLHVYLTYQI
ncbi:unnamed protein product [Protopolystoma xenopodis]|uniref:Uncharacterized protein n=1 Tax=Protopolystoma xenopodis TaxID=117903 RepID=A0A3S5A562_9PLAT|nr:unnamed protein product [Protopolystoma xenopodis]